jgi:hypothetical protein
MQEENEPAGYVITVTELGGGTSLRAILAAYDGLTVLDALDDTTALVLSTESVVGQVAREHPGLVVEPNLQYKKAKSAI